jgi:hypothetical protein
MSDQIERNLREAFSDRDAQLDPDSIARLRAVDYRPRRHRIGRVPTIGGLGTVGVAGVIAVIVSLSSGAAPAFAGWQSTPTPPAPGQLAQANQACGQGLGSPVLTDSRGPYTAAIYGDSTTDTVCISGNDVSMASTSSSSMASTSSSSMASTSTSSTPITVAPGDIQFAGQGSRDSAGNALTVADGRTGAGVTGVTIELSDGSSVQATVENGWYMAWWPGSVTAKDAEITTASGTSTVPYPAQPTMPPCPSGAHCARGFSAAGNGIATHGSSQTTSSFGGTVSSQ